MYDQGKCISCGRCVTRCSKGCHRIENGKHILARENCSACGECTSSLCTALALSGKDISASEVLTDLLKDQVFYKTSGGGITLSGGEPLTQGEFCVEILRMAKENGLHTCIETCGQTSKDVIARSAEYTDLYLFDVKETDPNLHARFTGVDNRQIFENLDLLNTLGKAVILRCPLIPNFNCRDEHLIAIANIANSFENVIGIELEPYHELGASKYEKLGRVYSVSSNAANSEFYDTYVEILKNHTVKSVKILKHEL